MHAQPPAYMIDPTQPSKANTLQASLRVSPGEAHFQAPRNSRDFPTSAGRILHNNGITIIPIYLGTGRTSAFASVTMSSQTFPITIFYSSLDRFKIGLSDREKEDFELTSLDEVHNVVLEIQKNHASERRMQNMKRIELFLEGMEQYGSVIEVFLNASLFIAFVWVSSRSYCRLRPFIICWLTNYSSGPGEILTASKSLTVAMLFI